MSTILLALSSSLLLAAPAALAQSTGTGSCTDVHIFLAKGWNEQYDNQRQTTLVDALCSDLGAATSCDYEDIIVNDLSGSNYCTAVPDGTAAGKQQISSYAAKCPSAKLVVSGYSEGANVVGDILAGGGGDDCPTTTPLDADSDAVCQIAAVLMFGNPRHVPNTTYDVDSGVAGVGERPRTDAQISVLAGYASKLHDWCNVNDPSCAPGLGLDEAEPYHTNYFDLVTDDAASWAMSQIKAATACGKASSSSSSSSMVSTSSAVVSTSTSAAMSTSTEASMSSTKIAMTSSTSAIMTSAPAASPTDLTTAPAAYPVPTAAANSTLPALSSSIPIISGKPAYPLTSSYPIWANGTSTFATGSGSAAPSGTGSVSGVSSFTGAASSVKVAGGILGAVVGVVALMML